ncbi:MAG: hypothetical protein U0R64_04755 [Candidatus Nanopelagicales bacterium]
MRQLVLHIGVHRTATSSVQSYLWANAATLKEQGFLYPAFPPFPKRHVGLFQAVFSGSMTLSALTEELERRADSAPSEIHTVILSDEDVCERPLAVLGDLSHSFRVSVVFSMRRQDTWLESWYLQNIKWQWNPRYAHLSFEEFLDRREDFPWIHYDRTVADITDTFGSEALVPLVFERDRMPDGPVAAFRDAIGLAHTPEMTQGRVTNERFSIETSEFLRRLPLGDLPERKRAIVEAAIQRVGETASPEGATHLLTRAQRSSLLAEYAEGNRRVAERYFGQEQLFGEDMPADPPAQMLLPDSADLMGRYVGPLILELGPSLGVRPPAPPQKPAAAVEVATQGQGPCGGA